MIILINVYAPNDDCPEFIYMMECKMLELNCMNIILARDLNLALKMQIDKKGIISNNDKAAEQLRLLMSDHMISDVWRIRNPKKSMFTWRRAYWVVLKISLSCQVSVVIIRLFKLFNTKLLPHKGFVDKLKIVECLLK